MRSTLKVPLNSGQGSLLASAGVLAVGFAITTFIFLSAWRDNDEKLKLAFDGQVRQQTDRLIQHVKAYEQVLRGAQSLFIATSNVTRDEFRDYVASLGLKENYPGFQAIGLSRVVSQEDKAHHVEEMQRLGFPAYDIRPPGERKVYVPVVQLEPYSGRNLRVIGFDSYAESVRQQGMDRAVESGSPSISGKITLVQEDTQPQAGFVMYLPLFKDRSIPKTAEERRRKWAGFVYAAFRVDDLLAELAAGSNSAIDFHIYDEGGWGSDALMHDTNHQAEEIEKVRAIPFWTQQQINLPGRNWGITAKPLPSFYDQYPLPKPYWILIAGIAISLLMSVWVRQLMAKRAQAISRAESANEALEIGNQRLSIAADAAQIGIWDWNIVTNILIWDDWMYRIYGVAKEQFGGAYEKWQQGVHPDDRDRTNQEIQEALRGGEEFNSEFRVVHPDGQIRFIKAFSRLIRDSQGKPQRMIGINLDITDREKVEKALIESERRYRALIENATDAILAYDPTTDKFIDANKEAERIFGRSRDDLLSGGVARLYTLLPSEQLQEDIRQVYRRVLQGETIKFERSITVPTSGQEKIVEVRVADISESGRPLLRCSCLDVTERKRSEEAHRESEARFRALVEHAPEAIVVLDFERKVFVDANDNACKLYQLSREELMTKSPVDLSPPFQPDGRPSAESAIEKLQQALAGESPRFEWIHRNASGVDVPCEINLTRLPSSTRQLVRGSMIDITSRKAAEDQLRKLSLAVQQSPESIVITNLHAEIEYVNDAFVRKTGYSRDEVLGKNPRVLHSGKTPAATFASLWETLGQGHSWSGEFHNRCKDGSEYIEHAVITPIRQTDGSITHYVAVKEDITSRKATEEQINTLAFYDPLTGLPNRRLLLERLRHALAASARSQRHGILLFIDLDNFKTLNDTLGHDIGDLLLRQVAQRLATCVREEDTVARLGGDEFVVMLEDLSENVEDSAGNAKTVGEKILTALNQPYQLAEHSYHSTPSIGVALFSHQEDSIDELMKRADLAMYQAKAAGRNALRFYDPEMQMAVTRRATLEADLREGIRNDQFALHYQAQVVGEGRVVGAEVLLRWLHPERGLVSPNEFIPLAEDTGLILPLGHWVLETACAQLKIWEDHPALASITIAVNISARQIRQTDFANQVLAILDHTGANPRRLKLELTESLMVDDAESVIAKMNALKSTGIGFSLDDFGTGYSSLSYLKRLPLDQLKIDQGFVRDILTDSDDAAIAKMIVALGETLGLSVIAEGVEIEAQREFLAYHGCHVYQGYLFGRPVPLAEFESFAKKAFDDEQRLLSA